MCLHATRVIVSIRLFYLTPKKEAYASSISLEEQKGRIVTHRLHFPLRVLRWKNGTAREVWARRAVIRSVVRCSRR